MGGDSVFENVTVGSKKYTMGDLGSIVLPETPTAEVPTWVAGSTPRVAWGMRYNHGGKSYECDHRSPIPVTHVAIEYLLSTLTSLFHHRGLPIQALPTGKDAMLRGGIPEASSGLCTIVACYYVEQRHPLSY